MPPPKNPQQIQVFNGMAQFYRCFIKKIVIIMAPITKLTRKTYIFLWTTECQKAWELIKQKYIEATNIGITKLVGGVLCSYKCILVRCGGHVVSKCNMG